MVADLINWMLNWASTPYGGAALFVFAFAESSFFPIPPDALLIALSLINPELAFLYAAVCSVGSVIGGMFGYGIGIWGGRRLMNRWFSSGKIQVVEQYYKRWDVWAVGMAGFTPIPYKIFTISAGVFALDFKRFVLVSVISRSGRFFLVAGLFYFFGELFQEIFKNYFGLIATAFFVLLFLGFYAVKVMGKRAVAQENSVKDNQAHN